MKATDVGLDSVGSHWIGLEQGKVKKEELFPKISVTWRGARVLVEMSADRYVASSWDEESRTSSPAWTDWRIYARNAATDAQRKAFNEACQPLVGAWLASDDYAQSRQRAFAYALKRELRDAGSIYGVANAAETLDRYSDELTQADLMDLSRALEHLRKFYELIG